MPASTTGTAGTCSQRPILADLPAKQKLASRRELPPKQTHQNRPNDPTKRFVNVTAQTSHPAGPLREPLRAEGWRRLESVFVFLFFLTYAGQLAPAVNEAHYLCKARHYWDPTWCPNDQFMNSADTHLAFYWTFGWLTQVASLPVTAWLGRLVVWAMLTCGWMSLARAVCPIPGTALLGAALATALAELTNLAGEWCVGGVEGKVVAWALVLGASGCVIRDQWRVVWPLLGTAIAFHALVGGWAWLICVGVLYWSQRCEGGSLRTTLLHAGANVAICLGGAGRRGRGALACVADGLAIAA